MIDYKMNKAFAGFHILMILSAVDFIFHIEEEKIIREYLFQEFPFQVDLDRDMACLSSLQPNEWMTHFEKCLHDFHEDATKDECNNLLKFAVYLTKADDKITSCENVFLNKLFETWESV